MHGTQSILYHFFVYFLFKDINLKLYKNKPFKEIQHSSRAGFPNAFDFFPFNTLRRHALHNFMINTPEKPLLVIDTVFSSTEIPLWLQCFDSP